MSGQSFDKLPFPSNIKIPSDKIHADYRGNFLIENVREVYAFPIPCADGLGLCDDATSFDDWRETDMTRVEDYSKNRTQTSEYDNQTQKIWENIVLKESLATFIGIGNMRELGTPNFNWKKFQDIKNDKEMIAARKDEKFNPSLINPLYQKNSGKSEFYYHRRVQKRMSTIRSGKDLDGEAVSDEEDDAQVDWIRDEENLHYKMDRTLRALEDADYELSEDFYDNLKDVDAEEIEAARVFDFEKVNYQLGGRKSEATRRKSACVIQPIKRNVVISDRTVKEEKVGYILYWLIFDPLVNFGEGIEELIKTASEPMDKKTPEHIKRRYAGRNHRDPLRTLNMEKWIGLVSNYIHFVGEAEQSILSKKKVEGEEDEDTEEGRDEAELNTDFEYFNDRENQMHWEHSSQSLSNPENPLNPRNVWTVENALKYFAGRFDAVVPKIQSIRKRRERGDRETWDFTRIKFANQSWHLAEEDYRRNHESTWHSGPKMVNTSDAMDSQFFRTVYFCRAESMVWNDFDTRGRNLGLKNRYFPWIKDGWNTKLFLESKGDGAKLTEKRKLEMILKQKVIQSLPSMQSSESLNLSMANASYDLPESIFADRNWFILLKTKTAFYRDIVESFRPKGNDFRAPEYIKAHEEYCRKRELFIQTIGPFFQERVWTQDALVSEFMKAIIKYTKTSDFIKCRQIFHVNRADMDAFGQLMIYELYICRYVLLAVNGPVNLHIISYGTWDAYRMEWDLHFNVLSTGPNSQGKSYNMDLSHKHSVPGSTENVTSESKRANNSGTGDMSDRITFCDEALPEFFARPNDPKMAEPVAQLKTRLSTCICSRRVLEYEPNPDDPSREIRNSKVLLDNVIGCLVTAGNLYPKDPAIISRLYIVPHTNKDDTIRKENQKIREIQQREEGQEDKEKYLEKATVFQARSYKLSKYDGQFKKDYIKSYRFLQCSVAISFKLIYQTLLPKVNLDATHFLLGRIVKELERRGINTVTHRSYSRATMLTRVYTIVNAVMEVYGYENAECLHMDRELSHYIKLAPFLCASTQISIWAFTLMIKDHSNPVLLGSLRALMAEKSFKTMEKNSSYEVGAEKEDIDISDDELEYIQKIYHQKNSNFKRYRDATGNVLVDLNYIMLPGKIYNMVQIVMGNTCGEFNQDDVVSSMFTLSRTNMEFTNAFAPCSDDILQGSLDDIPRERISGPIVSFVEVSDAVPNPGPNANDGDMRVDSGPRCYVNVHAYSRLSGVESLLEAIIKSLGHKYSDKRVLVTGIPNDASRADMKEVKVEKNPNKKMTVDNVAGFMREKEMAALYAMQFHSAVENYNGKEGDIEEDQKAFQEAVKQAKKERQLKKQVIDRDIDEWALEKHFADAGIMYAIDRQSGKMLWKKWNDDKKAYELRPLPTPRNRMREILANRRHAKQKRASARAMANKRQRVENITMEGEEGIVIET